MDRRHGSPGQKTRSYVDYANRAAETYNASIRQRCRRYPRAYQFVTFRKDLDMDAEGLHPKGRGVQKYVYSLQLAVEAELRRPRGKHNFYGNYRVHMKQ